MPRSPDYPRMARCGSPTRSTATARNLLARVCNQHLEGLIAKKIDAPYRGDRSPDWLKIKCHREQEFVVGGAAYLPGRGTGTFSSLLVGVKAGKGLKYAGRVGGGFSAANAPSGTSASKKLARKDSPFDRLPDKRSGEILALDETRARDPGGVRGLDPRRHPAPAALPRPAPGPRSRRPWCAKNPRTRRTS